MYTLVPLGNPGPEYKNTRHNAGRIVTEMIEEDLSKLENLEILNPKSFMNDSGREVSEYLRYHEGRDLVVIYDDKDLPYGKIRISYDRGDGGHNGLKSVIESLGKKDFLRIRVGIAPTEVDGKDIIPPHGDIVQDYVLGKIREDEMEELRKVSVYVLNTIKLILENKTDKAMEMYN